MRFYLHIMLIKKKMDNLEVTKRRLTDNILVLYIITILLILLGQFLGMLLGFLPFMSTVMISGVFMVPHPPLIIPEIGRGEEDDKKHIKFVIP